MIVAGVVRPTAIKIRSRLGSSGRSQPPSGYRLGHRHAIAGRSGLQHFLVGCQSFRKARATISPGQISIPLGRSRSGCHQRVPRSRTAATECRCRPIRIVRSNDVRLKVELQTMIQLPPGRSPRRQWRFHPLLQAHHPELTGSLINQSLEMNRWLVGRLNLLESNNAGFLRLWKRS